MLRQQHELTGRQDEHAGLLRGMASAPGSRLTAQGLSGKAKTHLLPFCCARLS